MFRRGGGEESGALGSNHSPTRSMRRGPRRSRAPSAIQSSHSSRGDRRRPASIHRNHSPRSDRSPAAPRPSLARADHTSIKPTISRPVSSRSGQVRNHDNEFDPRHPDRYVWSKYGQYLITRVRPWAFNQKARKERSYEVNLAEVQRMYLVELRIRLARHITQWEKSDGREYPGISPKEGVEGSWEDDLHRYVQGLQDYDYMDKCSRDLKIDPFRITGEGKLDRTILNTNLYGIVNSHMGDPREVRRWDEHIRPIIRSRTDNWYKRLFARITVSAVGAGFLIGPMWLMMLNTGLYAALISTSVFVVIFGIMMAYVLDEHINVLSSTAAYAAVLVVFVGLRGEATGN